MPVVPLTKSTQDTEDSGSGNLIEAKLVDLDFWELWKILCQLHPCFLEPRCLLPAAPIVNELYYCQKYLDAVVNVV